MKELGISTLLREVLGLSDDKLLMMDWNEESKLVLDWAKKHNYYVYSEPKDSFFKWEAIKLAEEGGFDGVILESLSFYGSIFKIITPSNRGAQLSLFFHMNGKKIFNKLIDRGFIVDYREPNVVRVTPVPLYNSFMDVYNFVINLEEIINDLED